MIGLFVGLRRPRTCRTRAMLIIGLVATAASGCSSSPASATRSTASAVILHGWVVWSDMMPIDPNSHPTATSQDPLPLPTPKAYDSAEAQQICGSDFGYDQVRDQQVVIRGSNGDTLAGVSLDLATLQNGQTADQSDPTQDYGSDFTCLIGWHTPGLRRDVTYTVEFDGHSKVVNGSTASQAVYIAA